MKKPSSRANSVRQGRRCSDHGLYPEDSGETSSPTIHQREAGTEVMAETAHENFAFDIASDELNDANSVAARRPGSPEHAEAASYSTEVDFKKPWNPHEERDSKHATKAGIPNSADRSPRAYCAGPTGKHSVPSVTTSDYPYVHAGSSSRTSTPSSLQPSPDRKCATPSGDTSAMLQPSCSYAAAVQRGDGHAARDEQPRVGIFSTVTNFVSNSFARVTGGASYEMEFVLLAPSCAMNRAYGVVGSWNSWSHHPPVLFLEDKSLPGDRLLRYTGGLRCFRATAKVPCTTSELEFKFVKLEGRGYGEYQVTDWEWDGLKDNRTFSMVDDDSRIVYAVWKLKLRDQDNLKEALTKLFKLEIARARHPQPHRQPAAALRDAIAGSEAVEFSVCALQCRKGSAVAAVDAQASLTKAITDVLSAPSNKSYDSTPPGWLVLWLLTVRGGTLHPDVPVSAKDNALGLVADWPEDLMGTLEDRVFSSKRDGALVAARAVVMEGCSGCPNLRNRRMSQEWRLAALQVSAHAGFQSINEATGLLATARAIKYQMPKLHPYKAIELLSTCSNPKDAEIVARLWLVEAISADQVLQISKEMLNQIPTTLHPAVLRAAVAEAVSVMEQKAADGAQEQEWAWALEGELHKQLTLLPEAEVGVMEVYIVSSIGDAWERLFAGHPKRRFCPLFPPVETLVGNSDPTGYTSVKDLVAQAVTADPNTAEMIPEDSHFAAWLSLAVRVAGVADSEWQAAVANQVVKWLARPAGASAWIRRGMLAVAVTQDAPAAIHKAAWQAAAPLKMPFGFSAEEVVEQLVNLDRCRGPAALQRFCSRNPRCSALAGVLMARCLDSVLAVITKAKEEELEAVGGIPSACKVESWVQRAVQDRSNDIAEILIRFAMIQACDPTLNAIDCPSLAGGTIKRQPELQFSASIQEAGVEFAAPTVTQPLLHSVGLDSLLQSPQMWLLAAESAREGLVSWQVLSPLQSSASRFSDQVLRQAVPVHMLVQRGNAQEWASPMVVRMALQLLAADHPSQGLPEGLSEATLLGALGSMAKTMQRLQHHSNAIGENLQLLLSNVLPETADGYLCQTLLSRFHAACGLEDGNAPEGLASDRPPCSPLVCDLNIAQARASKLLDASSSGKAIPMTFGELVDLVDSVHDAVASHHKPLQSMWHEACDAAAAKAEVAHPHAESDLPEGLTVATEATLQFSHAETALWRLQQASQLFSNGCTLSMEICKQDGLSIAALDFLQRHWVNVKLSEIADIVGIMSPNLANADQHRISNQLLETIQGIKSAPLWKSCWEVGLAICSQLPDSGGLDNVALCRHGFRHDLEAQVDAMLALQQIMLQEEEEEEETEKKSRTETACAVTGEQLAVIQAAGRQTAESLQGIAPLETLVQVMGAMAEPSGKALLGLLQRSQDSGEDIMTRLTELVEGPLTQDTLEHISLANTWLQPLVIAGLRVRSNGESPSGAVAWHSHEWGKALHKVDRARSLADLGHVAMDTLRHLGQSSSASGHVIAQLDSIRTALRHGRVVEQKIQEAEDDAAAVSNAIKGMLGQGQLMLEPSLDGPGFAILAEYCFNGNVVTLDEQRLTECADKAMLAVPQGPRQWATRGQAASGSISADSVMLFTHCIQRLVGLRQHLVQLQQLGHPRLSCLIEQGRRGLCFPSDCSGSGSSHCGPQAGLGSSTLEELQLWLDWARAAAQGWAEQIDSARKESAIMSCLPARGIVPMVEALSETGRPEPTLLQSTTGVIHSVHPPQKLLPVTSGRLQRAWVACQGHQDISEVDGASYEELLDALQAALVEAVDVGCLMAPSPLQQSLSRYPRERSPNDVTMASIFQRRRDPALMPGRLLVVREESPSANQALQSATSTTVLSILLPFGVAPTPHNVLHCDGTTTSDCVLRFLHLLGHHTASTARYGGTTPIGVLVHADCLHLDVLRTLHNRLAELQDTDVPHPMRVAATVTRQARPEVVSSLASFGHLQSIKILKQDTVQRLLASCCQQLPPCLVATSAAAGQGKTHAIMRHPTHSNGGARGQEASSAVWGGTQTRAQAAAMLRNALKRDACVHLELYCFDDGGPVDIDMLTFELLLFGSVFDPGSASWVRLNPGKTTFVEAANTLMVGGYSLLHLAAPLLKCIPGQLTITGAEPFVFDCEEDAAHTSASSEALNFAIGGSGLMMGQLATPGILPVGPADSPGAVLWLMENGSVAAAWHQRILQDPMTSEVSAAATDALRAAWDAGQEDEIRPFSPPSKATIMGYMAFVSRWVREWARQYTVYHLMGVDTGADISGILSELLKQMCAMAASVCLASSAAQAQADATTRLMVVTPEIEGAVDSRMESGEDAFHNAMANRLVDSSIRRSMTWAFNAGGGLAVIGAASGVPQPLRQVWEMHNRVCGRQDRIHLPPADLHLASQAQLRDNLLQVMSGHGLETQELDAAFRDYVLHPDNLIKLVDVAERLRAGLPCLLMGEAGCGKTFLLRLASLLMGAGPPLELPVHAGTRLENIAEIVDTAERHVAVLQSQPVHSRPPFVIVFFDELNTCGHLPVFKRLFIDRIHPTEGRKVHHLVRFVGACNPWRKADASVVSVGFESPVLSGDRLAGLAYRVNPLPESLFGHLSSFGQLDAETEHAYVERMAQQAPVVLNADNEQLPVPDLQPHIIQLAARCIAAAHDHLRNELGVSVSLRDPHRFLRLWGFARWELQQRLATVGKASLVSPQARRYLLSNRNAREIVTMVLALHLTYELRLPDIEQRQALLKRLTSLRDLPLSLAAKTFGKVLVSVATEVHGFKGYNYEKPPRQAWNCIVRREEDHWLSAIAVGASIAPIRSLRENVHASLMGVMSRVPVFIVGKPGCSKTLTTSLLFTALSDSAAPALKHLSRLSAQAYQGSRQSTSASLLAVFDRAVQQQGKLRRLGRRALAVVLLDEVGLAEQSPFNPLKVLHAKLEPRTEFEAVPVVAISNWELDRSKMNRAMILGCPQPDHSDLVEIALAIIRFYLPSTSPSRRALERAVEQLAEQFQELLKNQFPEDFHGLRDWYGMCSHAARLLAEADNLTGGIKMQQLEKEDVPLLGSSSGLQAQAQVLVELHGQSAGQGKTRKQGLVPTEWALHLAVMANFSGNNISLDTSKLYEHKNSASGGNGWPWTGWRADNPQEAVPKLLELQPGVDKPGRRLDSLLADIGGRHIMVITSSPGPIIAWICSRASDLAGWNPEALVGSPLELDQASADMYAQSMLQAAIVSIAQERRLLVLHNLSAIYAALYDVFNANYTRGGGADSQKYCRIARAGFCNPRCAVAEHFKAVLVVTPERARLYEPALLNRFAKVQVEVEDLLEACLCSESSPTAMAAHEEWLRQAGKMWPVLAQPGSAMEPPPSDSQDRLPTDLVAGCPPQLLEIVSLSAQMRSSGSTGNQPLDYTEGVGMISERLLKPLLPLELLWNHSTMGASTSNMPNHDTRWQINSHELPPVWETQPTFASLANEARLTSASRSEKHTVMLLLITTFCDPEHWSMDLGGSFDDLETVNLGISMGHVPSQALLRQEMEAFLHRVAGKLHEEGAEEGQEEDSEGPSREILSALHVHVDIRQDSSRDVVDYLRFQLEWCQRRLVQEIEGAGSSACGTHIMALVVHGARGSTDPDSRLRPFLLAGPPPIQASASSNNSDSDSSKKILHTAILQWQGVAVDHFAPHFPWGLTSDVLLKGTKAAILGMSMPGNCSSSSSSSMLALSSNRFQQLLKDALPHVVPLMSCTEDTVAVIHSLSTALRDSEHLVGLLLELVRADMHFHEEDNWRTAVASNTALLRRSGSYQLALLSSIRCDDKLLPLLNAIWRHSLHTSCPKEANMVEGSSAAAWKPVAANLLQEAAATKTIVQPAPLLSSQRNFMALGAPGAPMLLGLLLPLAMASDLRRPLSSRRNEPMLETIDAVAAQMADMARAYIPDPLLVVLQESVGTLRAGTGILGPYGEDAITEVVADSWQGLGSLQLGVELQCVLSARLQELAKCLLGPQSTAEEHHPAEDDLLVMALRPVAAAGLLLPIAEYSALVMASIQRAEQAGCSWLSTAPTSSDMPANGRKLRILWDMDCEYGMWDPSQKRSWLDILSMESTSLLTSISRQLLTCLANDVEQGAPLESGLHTLHQLASLVRDAPTDSVVAHPELVRIVVISQMLCIPMRKDWITSVLSTMADKEQPILATLEALVTSGSDMPLPVVLAGLRHTMTWLPAETLREPANLSTALQLLVSLCKKAGASLPGELEAPAIGQLRRLALFIAEQLLEELVDTTGQVPHYIAILSGCERQDTRQTPAAVTCLLDKLPAFLPPPRCVPDWDGPLPTILIDALLVTSRISAGAAELAKRAISSRRKGQAALELLVGAFCAACEGVEHPQSSIELLLGLALGRALAVQSVPLVADLRHPTRAAEERFLPLKTAITQLLGAQIAGCRPLQSADGINLTTLGCSLGVLRVRQVPPPFASLFAVTATRAPSTAQLSGVLSTTMAVTWMRELAAETDAKISFHNLMAECSSARLSNGLGLSVLLPPSSGEYRDVVNKAILGSNGMTHAWDTSCRDASGSVNAVTTLLLALGEVVLLQRSAEEESTIEQSERARQHLPVLLGPADHLFRLAASDGKQDEARGEEDPFSLGADMLPCRPGMCPSELWSTSVLAHIVALLGGLAQAGTSEACASQALQPFIRMLQPSAVVLGSTFWPGLPENEWHAWLHSAVYRHRLGQGNVGVAQCECGYRYLLGECIAPTTSQPCGNPDGCESNRSNGGANHAFAAGQNLVAVPRATGYVYGHCNIGCDASPRPGLWTLVDGEMTKILRRGNARDATESNTATTVRGLRPLTFRALHLLVHAGALASVAMERAAGVTETSLESLQQHLQDTVRLRPAKDTEAVLWHLSGVVDADMDALARLPEINGCREEAALFIHAILARLQDLQNAPTAALSLSSPEGRAAYEKYFEEAVIQSVLKQDSDGLSAMGKLRRDAGGHQADTAGSMLPTASLLVRADIPDSAWAAAIAPPVRAAMIPHIMRPLSDPDPSCAFEQLMANEESFQILRLGMAGPPGAADDWPVDPDLDAAACLAGILPFLRAVEEQAGGSITMQEARETSFRSWINGRKTREDRTNGWCLYRSFELAWNRGCSADGNVRAGCRLISLPTMHPDMPLAMACPALNLPPTGHSDIRVGPEGSPPPEQLVATALHELAVKHNSVLIRAAKYCSTSLGSHALPCLHPATRMLLDQAHEEETFGEQAPPLANRPGKCLPLGHDEYGLAEVIKVQDAGVCDLLVYKSSAEENAGTREAEEEEEVVESNRMAAMPLPEMDLGIWQILELSHQVPTGATCQPHGSFDLVAAESVLAQWLLAGRPPLQVTSVDHSDMANDIRPFPYRVYHGSISNAVLSAAVAPCVSWQQVSLLQGLGEQRAAEFERLLFRTPVTADKVCELAGELIPILMGARPGLPGNVGTVAEFVQLCMRAGRSISGADSNAVGAAPRGCCIHPNALDRVQQLPEFGALPLSVLVASYLAARDLMALQRGLTVLTSAGDPLVSAAKEAELQNSGLRELTRQLAERRDGGRSLHVFARLLARCIYLSSEPPSATLLPPSEEDEEDLLLMRLPLCQTALSMDFLDELGHHNLEALLTDLLPVSMEHWSRRSHGHTLAVFSALRAEWNNSIAHQMENAPADNGRRAGAHPADDGDRSGLIRPALMDRKASARRQWTGRTVVNDSSSDSDSDTDDDKENDKSLLGQATKAFGALFNRRPGAAKNRF